MPDADAVILILSVLVGLGLQTLLLGVGLVVFHGRAQSLFGRAGRWPGWGICFGVVALVSLVASLPGGRLPAIALWWGFALTVFQLTVRQALQLNIGFAVVFLLFFVLAFRVLR